jgi:predicted DNA binding CopG/RHH family protein
MRIDRTRLALAKGIKAGSRLKSYPQSINVLIPLPLLEGVRSEAHRAGISVRRYIRLMLERVTPLGVEAKHKSRQSTAP